MAVFRVPVETHQFNPVQLQPRTALGLGFLALTRTYTDAGLSWPKMLREWRFGFVFARVALDYLEPLRFFDADELEVSSVMSRVRDNEMRWVLDVTIAAVGRPAAARVRMVLVPIEIAEPESLSARPAPLPEALAGKLAAGEVVLDRGEKLRDLAGRIRERDAVLGEHRSAFAVDRTLCEVADQWYMPDIPRLLEPAREALALARAGAEPRVADALARPLRRLDLELTRPYFWRHAGEVHAQAFAVDGRLVVVHELRSTSPIAERCGVAVESW